MDNAFITKYFDWPLRPLSKKADLINGVLSQLGVYARLGHPPDSATTGVMTNIEQRMNMYHLLSAALAYGVAGDVVELGCNTGQSSVLFQTIIEHMDPARKLHVYDSFEGLPGPVAADGDFLGKGGLKVSREILAENFQRHGLRQPIVHEGWFEDTLPNGLPEAVCFAHLDGDFYESILVSLEHVYPRLSRGAVCLIDDYADPSRLAGWNKLPGVKKACDEFLADKPEAVSVLWAGAMAHGFFRKT